MAWQQATVRFVRKFYTFKPKIYSKTQHTTCYLPQSFNPIPPNTYCELMRKISLKMNLVKRVYRGISDPVKIHAFRVVASQWYHITKLKGAYCYSSRTVNKLTS